MTGEYRYDDNGIRTYKEINGNVTKYYLNGSTILTEETNYGGVSRRIDYVYDENGSVYGFSVGNQKYYYQKNLQGDIIGILDKDGDLLVKYVYDAYGVPTTSFPGITSSMSASEKQEIHILGSNNPFRYRSYYFDTETGFYYLNSRYYDPVTGRFLNADSVNTLTMTPEGVTDKNLFSYCDNNPVIRADDGGEFWNFIIGGVVGAVVGGGIDMLNQLKSGKSFSELDWASIGINAAVGAVSGVVAASGLGVVCQAGLTAAVAGAGNFAEQAYKKGIDEVNYLEVATTATVSGLTSLAGSGTGKLVGGGIEKAGNALINKGKDKLLIGVIRKFAGQSHSSYLRQGSKYFAQGVKKINTYRGLSSSIGSLIGGATTNSFNYIKNNVFEW